ncbi:hypothetical protein HY285_03205 [Candidatus Peregrinibacteria bacterium]|nr:hypothetical protein [Candidatus Peregrinibacteria bacterium]MBI3816524.1 hypothetical protein [Candidatus Peregrinibacteria bacterium]
MPKGSSHPRLFCSVLLGTLIGLVLLDRMGALLLPPQALFFRGWEYVSGAGRYNIPRRRLVFREREYGDLANMLGVEQYKEWRMNTYTMDEEGYRNAHGSRRAAAPLLLSGDSFAAGVGNTDEQTFAVELERTTGLTVEPYVPGDLSLLLRENRFPPSASGSLLVWERVERNLTVDDAELQKWMRDTSCLQLTGWKRSLEDWKTRVKRVIGDWVEYTHLSPVRLLGEHLFQTLRFSWTKGHASAVLPAEDDSDMLFFAKDVRLLGQNAEQRQLDAVADAIAHARDCLARRGLGFLVVLVPDKSHVYLSHVPPSSLPLALPSPDTMEVLQGLLRKRRIATVNLLPAFRAHARRNELLYWNDDTHWNAEGIRLAAQTVVPTVRMLLTKK